MKDMRAILFISLLAFIIPFGQLIAADVQIPVKKLVVLFTHDLHSYFLPQTLPLSNGGTVSLGGYARLSSMIRAEKARSGDSVIVVDAGDFSMGTLFHTLFTTEAADLRMLGKLGYDAVTIGNHEFDFHTDGLAQMMRTARQKEKRLPEILAANIGFNKDCLLKKEFASFPVKPYIVLVKNGLRIGIFGIIGKDAVDVAPFSKPAVFDDPVETAKKMVKLLREKEKADIIVCLSHSGTYPVKKYSEDENLAEKVPGIDVIVSGHTHTLLVKPIVIGKTVIGSALSYGNYLGRIELEFSTSGSRLLSYQAIPVTKEIAGDPAVTEDVNRFEKLIERNYLDQFGYRYAQDVSRSGYDMETLQYFTSHTAETGLGDLVSDAYRYAISRVEGNRWEYISMSIEPNGHIRDTFIKDVIRVPDIFRVLSLGLGPDGIPGYPLVAFYVTGKELKNILEVHASVAPLKPDAVLQVSGVRFAFNPHRMIFDRVTGVQVEDSVGYLKPLELKKLYRIAMNYYSANMVAYVGKLTFGLLTMVPKDRNGNPLPDITNAIVDTDPGLPGAQELKEWKALAIYLSSFDDVNGDGLAEIPAQYQKPSGRIQPVPSKRLGDIYSNAGVTTRIVLGLWIGIPLIVLAIVLLVILRKKK